MFVFVNGFFLCELFQRIYLFIFVYFSQKFRGLLPVHLSEITWAYLGNHFPFCSSALYKNELVFYLFIYLLQFSIRWRLYHFEFLLQLPVGTVFFRKLLLFNHVSHNSSQLGCFFQLSFDHPCILLNFFSYKKLPYLFRFLFASLFWLWTVDWKTVFYRKVVAP